MPSQDCAEVFLKNIEPIYDDCDDGISKLDRIIVSVSNILQGRTRFYLIPMLYAYWERFFKLSLLEYLRSLHLANKKLTELNQSLAEFLVVHEIGASLERLKIDRLNELPRKVPLPEMVRYFSDFASWILQPVEVVSGEDMIVTESNVDFRVLEKNCKNLGIDIRKIKNSMAADGHVLFPTLKQLVVERNDIAHGAEPRDISAEDWATLRSFTLNLMNALQMALYETLAAL
jgi:hypothetical protein